MTVLNAIGIILIACGILGAMLWAIHIADQRADRRIRHMTAEALNKPLVEYRAYATALDDEYRQLVLEEHNKDNA
jgi:hypothetical protein